MKVGYMRACVGRVSLAIQPETVRIMVEVQTDRDVLGGDRG